eukprot:403369221
MEALLHVEDQLVQPSAIIEKRKLQVVTNAYAIASTPNKSQSQRNSYPTNHPSQAILQTPNQASQLTLRLDNQAIINLLKKHAILKQELLVTKREFLKMGNELLFGMNSLVNIIKKFDGNND